MVPSGFCPRENVFTLGILIRGLVTETYVSVSVVSDFQMTHVSTSVLYPSPGILLWFQYK